MRSIPAAEFQTQCMTLMDEVESGGEPVVITREGKPVARLMPPEPGSKRKPRRTFGAMRGMAVIVGDIVSSEHTDEEWERMADEKFSSL